LVDWLTDRMKSRTPSSEEEQESQRAKERSLHRHLRGFNKPNDDPSPQAPFVERLYVSNIRARTKEDIKSKLKSEGIQILLGGSRIAIPSLGPLMLIIASTTELATRISHSLLPGWTSPLSHYWVGKKQR
jgi:hypothetical protein